MAVSAYRFARGALFGLVGFFAIEACSSDEDPRDEDPGPARGGAGGTQGGSQQVMPDVTTPATTGGNGGLNPSCGIADCVPDNPRACASLVQALSIPSGGAGGGGGAAGSSGDTAGGALSEGGSAGRGPGAGASAGSAGAAGSGDAAAGALGAAGAPTGPVEYSCRVVRGGSRNTYSSAARCEASGRGASDDPCFSGADCAAGLACVTDGAVARCRPYCCGGESVCDDHPGTYCAPRRLQDDSFPESVSMLVPVCAAADHCDLGAPYPCTAGRACECPTGTACVVARPDGTTTCDKPGSGRAGEPCPCDAGFVCSQSVATCLKLCEPSESVETCGDGRCQASAELPQGWGVCVGGTAPP